MSLEKYLKSIYDIPDDSKLLNILTLVPIFLDFEEYQNNLKKFMDYTKKNKIQLSRNEVEILNNEISPYRYLIYLIRQNYFINYYLELELILNGINSSCSDTVLKNNIKLVDYLFSKKENIAKINKLIIKIYNSIIDHKYPLSEKYDLKKFYNRTSLEKFVSTLDFNMPKSFYDKLSSETKFKLITIYKELLDASNKTKEYILGLLKRDIFESKPTKYGLSNFDSEFYIFNLRYMCGLKLKSDSDIEYLYNWAHKYLKNNISKIKATIKQLYPDSDDRLTFKELTLLINNDKKYRFGSEKEMTEAYLKKIEEKHDLMKKKKFPFENKCGFSTFNSSNLPVAFYLNNCFHLNICNWENQKKFEVRALTMHESCPGHHMQLDISSHHNKNNFLSVFFQEIFSAYIEGWALFAEKIHSENDVASKFGELDLDLLRILRIIADIDIHYYGKSPEEVIDKMASYLSLDRSLIVPEVYRYEALPAQAISYKMGESVFMGIYYKFKEVYPKIKIDDTIMIDEYIKILVNGELTLEELLEKYSMRFFY